MSENIFFNKSQLRYCGSNVIIGKTVRIRSPEKVTIGDNVIIDDFTYMSGEISIGDYVHIGPGCVLSASSAKISLGAFSGLSAGCKVYGGSSSYIYCGLDIPTIPIEHQYNVIHENVEIGSFCLVGASSIILPGCTLPQGFAVAAALTLRKNLKIKSWHLLVDDGGTQVARRGMRELKDRVSRFYTIEINYE